MENTIMHLLRKPDVSGIYLNVNPENRVEVLLHIYENLDDEAMKNITQEKI